MFHQEAGLAHELAGTTRLDAIDRVAALVGIRLVFVIFVGLVVGSDHTVFEDGVKVGLDVIGDDDVIVVIVVLGRSEPTCGRSRGVVVLLLFVVGQRNIFITDKGVIYCEIVLVKLIGIDVVGLEVFLRLLIQHLEVVGGIFIRHGGAGSYAPSTTKARYAAAKSGIRCKIRFA